MPDEIYEIISLAARYWFLLLMVLIAWRSYRWYARDRKKNKRRLKLLPDAGYIGELVVTHGEGLVQKGTCLPVGREGVLGYLRSNDVCVPVEGIANRHLWYEFDDTDGLRVEPFRGRMVVADGQELVGRRMRAFLCHGSVLEIGQVKLRLRMFSGFEYAGEAEASRKPLDETEEPEIPAELEETAHSDPVRRMHEIAAWQTMLEGEETDETAPEFYLPEEDGEDTLPPTDGISSATYEVGGESTVFYPPVMDGADGETPPIAENGEAPKALYVDEDEAATAKRVFWDKVFRGGKKR